jgi:hypothetical protein
MPRLAFDPSLARCPDFATPLYDPARARFVNANTTDEQAAILLTEFWQTNNDLERQQWADQVNQDLADQAAQLLQEQDDDHHAALLAAQEQDALQREEMKKNRAKYIPIPNRAMPAVTLIFPAAYAVKKMERGQYVELWYYTNDGLHDAARSQYSDDDEAMVLSRNPDGTSSWVSAAASRESKKIIDDKNLHWDDFAQAVPRMLVAMENSGWPGERIAMLAGFWGNLQTHELRSSINPLDQRTLLAYQAKHRRQWHAAITSPNGAYNISIIDESRMRATREEIYWEDRNKRDNERDCQYTSPTSPFSFTLC